MCISCAFCCAETNGEKQIHTECTREKMHTIEKYTRMHTDTHEIHTDTHEKYTRHGKIHTEIHTGKNTHGCTRIHTDAHGEKIHTDKKYTRIHTDTHGCTTKKYTRAKKYTRIHTAQKLHTDQKMHTGEKIHTDTHIISTSISVSLYNLRSALNLIGRRTLQGTSFQAVPFCKF